VRRVKEESNVIWAMMQLPLVVPVAFPIFRCPLLWWGCRQLLSKLSGVTTDVRVICRLIAVSESVGKFPRDTQSSVVYRGLCLTPDAAHDGGGSLG
jgi:hypothetical protein